MLCFLNTIQTAIDPLMEMSVLSSLNAAIDTSRSPDGVGGSIGTVASNALSSFVSQFVPTFTGKLGQFADPTVRTTKADATSQLDGNTDSKARALIKKIPGLEATLEPYVDRWGRTQQKTAFGEWALDFANKFVLPGNVEVKNRSAVDNELIRLVERTGNTDILPTEGRKFFMVNGQKYPMNASQYTYYSRERGVQSYAAIKTVMATAAYKNADDVKRAALLKTALDKAVEAVNDKYKEQLGAFDG